MINKVPYTIEETLLKAENVNLSYGENCIFRDINIEIKNIERPGMQQGQVIGFLGPSGVGKTKLSEILSGIIPLNKPQEKGSNLIVSGSVLVGQEQLPTKIGRIGVVQQHYPLLIHRSILGNFRIVAQNRYKDKAIAESKVEQMINMLNLQNHGNHHPSDLSGGQKQRVAIGQALLNCEDFIIFDEPFSGLDINMVNRVTEMIQELTAQSELLTIIIISHDISATTAVSDTLWIMGKEKNEQNEFIPGAKIVKQINLMDRGLAWMPDITLQPEFSEVTREIRAIFPNLM